MSDTAPRTPDDAAAPDDATILDDLGPDAAEPDHVAQPLSDDHDDNLTSLLAKREHAKPNRATWVLLTLMVLAVGFVGGAYAQSMWGSSASSSTLPDFAAMAGQLPGAAGGTSTGTGSTADASGSGAAGGFAGGFPGGMTVGTLTAVDGNTLTITGQDGSTTTVTVPDTATVTASSEVPLTDLTVGENVIVQGEAGDDGTVTASSVSQGGGGFPGGGFPGGGQGAAPSQTDTDQQSAPSGAPAPSTAPSTAPDQGDAS